MAEFAGGRMGGGIWVVSGWVVPPGTPPPHSTAIIAATISTERGEDTPYHSTTAKVASIHMMTKSLSDLIVLGV